MSLYALSIRRPVLAVVLSLVIVLFGLIAFRFLGVREYPSVDAPVITVTTRYVGANADVIETQVTQVLEEEINAVPGIRSLTSTSREGRSTLVVEFELGIDLETAANDVREKAARAMRELPPEADPPAVSKADADRNPIIFLNIQSDERDLLELTSFAENVFKERLQTITGVSAVDIWGEKRYAMRLWIDPAKLAGYGLTPVDVQTALQRENVELPSGRIEGADVELAVRTSSRLQTEHDFDNLVLTEEAGSLVKLSDVGWAELAPENMRTLLRRDGVPMVGVVLRPQPGANQIEIVEAFYARVNAMAKDLPKDIRLGIGFDSSHYIRQSVDEVRQTLIIAFSLVVLVIFVFLRDWRTTLIPALVIPVSLIGVFFVMYIAGFSINVLTLLGMVLAIGLVVDDAIVVLENIYTKIERDGMDPIRAGIEGTREIFFAVIATTITLVAVFLPILFLGGLTGRLFREFGITLAGAVVISSFAALTLTPMLATRWLKKRARQPWIYRVTEPFFAALTSAYRTSLVAFLRVRWLAVLILITTLGAAWWLGTSLPKELAPIEDRGSVRISATAPEGASFEYMDRYVQQIDAIIEQQVPERNGVISVTSPGFGASSSVNSGFARIRLVPSAERERSQQEVADDLSAALSALPGARVFVSQSPTIGGRRSRLPVQVVLQAPSFEALRETLPRFLETAEADPAFSVVDVDLKFNKPELRIDIDRDRARDLGTSALAIGRTLSAALSAQRLGYFLRDGKQYPIISQLVRHNRDEPVDLNQLFVRSENGNLVQLDNVASLSETVSPPQIYHYNRYVSATVSAGLAPGVSLGQGIEAMQSLARRELPETFSTALTGQSRNFVESASSLGFVFLLALVLIYLVLAAQFESFRDPMTIMLTVPLALAGALAALTLFGQTLNVFSQIGLIMLIGLVTKNGILIVEFANQRRDRDADLVTAVRKAAVARFRPVLMTSLSTILGILPIALALGAGAESRKSMGIAVIGGLTLGSLLTLYIVPAMYTLLASRQGRRVIELDPVDAESRDADPVGVDVDGAEPIGAAL